MLSGGMISGLDALSRPAPRFSQPRRPPLSPHKTEILSLAPRERLY